MISFNYSDTSARPKVFLHKLKRCPLFYDDLNIPPPVTDTLLLKEQPVLKLREQQVLVAQGEVSHSVYWLEQGLVRAVFTDENGKEITKEFFWEGDIILQPRSLLTGEPLPYSIVTLEPCHYRMISISEYLQAVERSLDWQQYHQRLLEIHLVNKERKEEFLLLNSPEKRVARFGETFPWLINRIPDYIVASYLGMTAISYSRIKKRLA